MIVSIKVPQTPLSSDDARPNMMTGVPRWSPGERFAKSAVVRLLPALARAALTSSSVWGGGGGGGTDGRAVGGIGGGLGAGVGVGRGLGWGRWCRPRCRPWAEAGVVGVKVVGGSAEGFGVGGGVGWAVRRAREQAVQRSCGGQLAKSGEVGSIRAR
jgi:hypothetical protein